MGSTEIQLYPFAIVERPQCVYVSSLKRTSLSFLDGIDAGYFRFIAATNAKYFSDPIGTESALGRDQPAPPADREAHHAAVVVRLTYSQALETLFALLGAVVQAPECPPAWITRYQPKDLGDFVRAISNGSLKY